MTTQILDNLYDDAEFAGYDLPLNPNLTASEIVEAEYFKQIMFGTWIVTGPPGSGKDVFTHTVAYKTRRYFGIKVMLDHKPRRLFGEYTFFDPDYLITEVKKMAVKSGIDISPDKDLSKWENKLSNATDKWLDEHGEVTFKNAFLVLGELKNYFYNRRPHNPLGILMSRIITSRRHLNLVIVGSTPFENEIDVKAFQQYITCRVKCSQMISDPETCQMTIMPEALATSKSIISNIRTKALPYEINGKTPRATLGLTITGLGLQKLGQGYSIMTDFEKMVLSKFSDTPLTFDEIIASMDWDIDDTDAALKRLVKFGYLTGPGYFDIFNSKNYTNLQPALRKSLRKEAQ
jgi:hypothetical protein